jgi:hypothetical protein
MNAPLSSTKKDNLMSAEDHVNGGDEHAPSRPGLKTFLLGAAVIAAGALLVNWEVVSAFIRFPQIKLGLNL